MGVIFTGATGVVKPEKFSPASSFISEIKYDPKESAMEITFKSGTVYKYLQISPTTYLSFKSSPTIDSFYSRAIKGNSVSIKLTDQGIGRTKSMPLKKVKEEGTLNAGIRKQQARDKRIFGTVERAINAAAA